VAETGLGQWEKKAAGETGWSDVDSEENLDIL
jgi:hypothetical protein